MNLLQKLWPQKLFPRMLLLIVLALLVAQGLSLWALSSAHRDALRDHSNRFQLRQFLSLVQLLEEIPEELHGDALKAWRRPGLSLGFFERSPVEPASEFPAIALQELVVKNLGEPYQGRVRLQVQQTMPERKKHDGRGEDDDEYDDDEKEERYHRHPGQYRNDSHPGYRQRPPGQLVQKLSVAVQLNNGRWFAAMLRQPVIHPRFAYPTLVFVGTAVILVLLVVFWQLRKITRPLQQLGEAAEALGKGQSVLKLDERGPEDIQQTLRAFNQMNERIKRFVSDRTQMLAALSHDLRTPITTMRLRLEMMEPNQQRDKLLESLDEMQQMSEAALAFARESGDTETSTRIDVGALVESLCEDLIELGEDVRFEEPAEREVLMAKPMALKRAVRNLLENAVRYGERARVRLQSDKHSLAIVIQDSGPGIPEDQLKMVFEPFVRLEGSRSRETGGAGLGLAIARQNVRGLGGDISLSNKDAGLEVRVDLPRE